jgi:hypothetical protein
MTSAAVRKRATRAHWPLLALGAAGLVWSLAALGDSGGATSAYGYGGALVVATCTAMVISAIATRDSAATWALALPAVAYLGRLSYAMYLWHWPLQVWTAPDGWWDLSGMSMPARASLLTALTIGAAALSYHLIEKPVRFGAVSRFLVPRRALVIVPLALGAMFLAATNLIGDSVPQRLAPDLSRAAARHGYALISATRGGCPATGAAVVDGAGKPVGEGAHCATSVARRQDAAIGKYRPLLVIWWSRYEIADRVDSWGRLVPFSSPAYWRLQREAFAERTAALTRYGATVVAVHIERSGLGVTTRCRPGNCGPFVRRLIEATGAQDTWNRFLASHTTGPVRSISIQNLVCHDAASPCDDRLADGSPARFDGTHYTPAAAPVVARAVIDRSLAAADPLAQL